MAKKKEAEPVDLTDQKDIEVLYLGIGTDRDSKHVDRWLYLDPYPEEVLPLPVNNDGRRLREPGRVDGYDTRREWRFGKFPPPAGARPGAICKVKAIIRPNQGASVWAHSAEIIGVWKNDEDVKEWNAQIWHDRAVQRSQTEARKKASRQLHLEDLDTFRRLYQKLPHMEQPLFLANVIAYITRGTKALREED